MTENRLNHKLDVTKLKTIKDVRNVFDTLELVASFSVDNEKYEMAKEYYTIPYEAPKLEYKPPRKSLEEIQQELDEKIDKHIERIQDKFVELKCNQEYYYNQRFNKIIENFEYAKKYLKFPEIHRLIYSDNLDVNKFTSSFVIKEGGKEVGYYTFGNGYLKYFMDKKPNFVVRFCMDKLLGFRWVSV